MNHIYKSIFNKALGVFTAVPEFASAHGKGSERTVVGRVAKGTAGFAASALAISIGLALSSNAMANVDTDVASGVLRIADPTGTNSIRMGSGTTLDDANKQWNSVSIGVDAGVNTASSVSIGYGAKAGKTDKFLGQGAVALGYNAQALGTSNISIGEASSATNGHNGVAIGAYSKTENEKTISIGAFSTASGAQSTVISSNYDTNSTGPVSVASGRRSQIYGAETTVSGEQSVSIGDTNTIASARTYAMGNNINIAAGADDSLVFGTQAAVNGSNAVAMGSNAKALTDQSIAIGRNSKSGKADAFSGNKSIAIGDTATAMGTTSIAMGANSSTSNGHDSIALGTNASTSNQKATAIGSFSAATGRQSLVIANNYDAKSGQPVSVASGTRATVIGAETTVSGNNSVAIGDTNTVASARTYALGNNINAAAGTDDSLVFGTKAGVGGANAIALGNTAKATKENTIAQGTESVVYGKNSVSIGYKAVSGIETPTPTQTNAFSVSIGNETEAIDASTIAIGDKAKAKGGVDALAVGTQANAMTYKALAIGAYSQATGRQSTVIGNDIQGQPSIASGTRSQILGVQSNVSGDNSVSIGDTNTVASARTYALGNNINVAAGADDSLVFGTRAAVGAANTVAIGANANAAQANSVALGAGSATSAPHTGNYTLNTSYTAAGQPVAANGTVSVGSAGKERQIQNVAAGVISATSTDAINGSQLYATNNYMSNFATGVQNVLGGDAAVDNAGNLTMSNIGGTGKGNVNDAIAAANTKVVAGENITVTPTTNTDGSKTYTVATKKDLVVDSVKAGDTTVNTDGVTIANGPSITKSGINANGRKVTGLVDGDINATSTDAVNGSQLHATNTKLADVENTANTAVQEIESANPDALSVKKDGTKVTLTPNVITGDLVNPATGAVNTPAAGDAGKLVTAGTVANALANTHFVVDTKATNGELDTASQADQKIKSGNKVTLQAGKNLKAKQTNGTDGAQVEFSLKDSISLTQVTAGTGANQVVLGNDGVKVGGKTYINNDGLNANGNKITNVANGVDPTDAVNKGQLDAVKGVADSAVKSVDVANGEQNLVVDNTDAKNPKLSLKKDLTLDSVKAGDSTLNTDGLTIAGGPSVKKDGINAGNKTITGVADGNVAAGSTDAVNGGQLAEVKSKADSAVQNVVSANPTALTATKAGDTVTLAPNFIAGDLVNADGTVNAPAAADEGKLVSAKAVADALKANHFVVDTKANGGKTEAGSEENAKVGSSNKVTFEAGKNLVAKQANTANGGATVKFSLQDDISLNSVTAGAGDNQVVLGNDGVKVGGKTYINNDGLNANDKKITNVAPGAVTPTSKDAVNGGQLYDVAKNVADLVGPDAKIDPATGKVSVADPAQGIGGTGKDNIGDAIKAVNATAAKHTTVVEGKNVKVTKGKNAAGGDEYTVATKDDLEVTSVTAGNTTVNTNGLTITGGPSVTRGGIDAGNRVISGVKAGDVSATSQEAVNGSQLHATNTKLDGVKAKADTAVQDVKSGDENALTAVKDPNTNIVTVTPKLSGDLVDADGNITAPATPADKGKLVTAGTVAQALANTHFVVDTKATDGELDTASEADQKIKAGNKVTLQAGKNLKAKQTNGANGAQVEFSLKDSISLKEVTAGEGANQVVLGNDGVKVGGNTYINNAGLNANGNKITNVADGVDPTDAVNKGQLDAVKTVADSAVKSVDVANGEQNLVVDNTDPKNPKLSLKKDLTVDSVKAGDSTLNNDGLTIAGGPSVKKDGIDAGDKKITNVAAGDVAENSKDAVNGGQLYDVAKNVADLVGPDAKIDPATGKVTVADPAKGIGETGKGNIGDAIKHVNDLAKNAADTAKKHTTVEQGDNIVVEESLNADGGKHYKVSTAKDLNVDSVKAGDTTVNNDGVTINNGPSMTKDGINANNTKVTNVADGVDAADAVNKGQLDKVDTKVSNVAQNVVNVLGGDATVNGNGDITMSNIGETGKGNINDAIKSVNDLAKKAAAEKTSVKAKEGRSNVTVTEGVNAAGGHEYTVDVERAVTEAGSDQVTVTSKHDADSNTTTYTVDVSDKTKASLAKADSAVQGLTSKDGNLNFNKGPNGNVEVSFNDNLNVKNITTDGVKAGDTTINSNGVEIVNGPSMTKDGINAGGKAITNVANGNLAKGSKDAVNGGQLHETAQSVADVIGGGATVKDGKVVAGQNGIGNTGQNTVHGAIAAINQNTANNFNQIRGDLRKMDRDLRGGIAGALATAGLPQAFRPGKSMVAAAASTYRGQSGLAIGVSRISDNGKVILKVTGNTNSRGDFGGTIGAGYQW